MLFYNISNQFTGFYFPEENAFYGVNCLFIMVRQYVPLPLIDGLFQYMIYGYFL